MRVSQQFTSTLREAPRDAEGANQELLVRAGFLRQLTAGVYSFLPLGNRVIRKIAQIVREEMDRVGGQEVTLPVLQPKVLWEQRPANGGATRAEYYAPLFQLTDRRERELVLGPTHEEIAALLAKEFLHSYRDMPQLLYQIQTKFRDEPRPRAGLLRTREFLMKDLYSFDTTFVGLDASYEKMRQAYSTIFTRCGFDFIAVQADSGAIGGKASQEFIAITDAGEDEILHCDTCGYAANREKAEFVRRVFSRESDVELEEVYTPECSSISDISAFLGIPTAKTLKAVCYSATGRLVMVLVRGDLEINEVKLTNTLTRQGIIATDLHLATPEELEQAGIVAGYTSPLGKSEQILIIADISLKIVNNLVAGGNKRDYHIKNVNYPRDFRVDVWDDIASAYDGASCTICGGTLHSKRGSELGHIFKIGTRYSELFNVTYQDEAGNNQLIVMGSYGIGISRLMAIAVEQQHDEKGMLWPFSIAPYHVYLIGLDLDKAEAKDNAEKLYAQLQAAGIEVLFDDRSETAGIKFNDADLIGLPLRTVISKRSLKNGGIELKRRTQKESRIVSLENVVHVLQEEISQGLAGK